MMESVSVAVNYITVFKDFLLLDLSTCPISVYLASAEKNDVVPNFEQMLMTGDLTEGFRTIIANIQEKYQKETNGNNTLFSEYFIESVLEENEIECFTLASRNSIYEQVEPLKRLADTEIFSEEEQFIKGVRFYVIIAQPENCDPIYFFHVHTPKKILKRSGLRAILGSNGRYNRVDDLCIAFEETADCICHSSFMFVFNKNNFQTMFRFLEETRATAKETLNTINSGLPIQNFDELVKACEGNMPMLRKLKKISAKPYIKTLKMSDVKRIIESNNLPVKIIEIEGQEKILFDPNAKARDKYALLRVFNDDYLKSLMTDKNYEVTGKREV